MIIQNNLELIRVLMKMFQDEEMVNLLANYGKNQYQLTRSDIHSFKTKSKLKYITDFLKRRINDQINQQQKKEIYGQKHQILWNNNQYKVFVWITICYSYLKQNGTSSKFFINRKYIQQSEGFIDWLYCNKSTAFLKYSECSLIKQQKKDRERFSQEELQLLKSILIRPEYYLKWTKASIALFIESNNLFYRSPQKCRQVWLNRLNPSVTHSQWTSEQDTILIMQVYHYGKKWAKISRLFNETRNEHMVKNRYNSLMNKYKSFIEGYSYDLKLQILLNIISGDKSEQEMIPESKIELVQNNSPNQQYHLLQKPLQQKNKKAQESMIELEPLKSDTVHKYMHKRLIFSLQEQQLCYEYPQDQMMISQDGKQIGLFNEPLPNIDSYYYL